MNLSSRTLLALTAAAALGVAAQAQADSGGVKAGMLTCNVASGWGFVFGSTKKVDCTFAPDSTHTEKYYGRIDKYGVDIGYTAGGVMVWTVFAPSGSLAPGSLAGGYGGATGGASVGVGANANVLLGGSSNHISLQPLSLEGATGLNVAGGVAALHLKTSP
jgi:hypothetical protein